MKYALASLCSLVVACSARSDAPPSPSVGQCPPGEPGEPTAAASTSAAARMARTATRDDGELNPRLIRRFKPLRAVLALADAPAPSAAMVDLGRMLFFDKRLSKDRRLSCNSCHALDDYGVDHERTSIGASGKRVRRNAPSVYHAAGHFTSFWDGRVTNVEEQAKLPILDPDEMSMESEQAVVDRLARIPGYVTAFGAAFPGDKAALSYDNLGRAIGAFERGLVTSARWDRFIAGNRRVLSAPELAGLKLFMDLGCMTCHTGEFVGGTMFQKVGEAAPWPNQRDQGRYEVTRLPSDRMLFKVPSLRNVAKTAPYFHDGTIDNLEEAVTLMARFQIGEELSAADASSIVSWLGALTGDLPSSYITPRALPAD